MIVVVPNDATHAVVLRIEFDDGGAPEESAAGLARIARERAADATVEASR